MSEKRITGILEGIDIKYKKSDGNPFWLIKIGNLSLTCWNELFFKDFNTGNEVTADYEEKQNGIYTNRTLIKMVKKETEEIAQEKMKEIDFNKIAEKRIEKIEKEITNTIEINGKKYRMILQEI